MKITKQKMVSLIREEINSFIIEAELPGAPALGKVSSTPIDIREAYEVLMAAARVLYDDANRAGLVTALQEAGYKDLAMQTAKLRGDLLQVMSDVTGTLAI